MKKTSICILIFLIGARRVEAQWYNLNSPTSSYLYSTYFTNYDTGYAVGGDINSSIFLKTVNGGLDWNVVTNTQTKWLYDLVFLNDTVGLACGYDGAMYKTTNGGASWSAKPSQTISYLYAIAKKPDGTVYATGQDGTLIRSTNMGDNWSNVVSSTIQTMLDLQFLDNNYGVAVGYAGEMIYTTDGGNNWAVKLMGTPGNITGVWMISPDTMWTVGLQGKMYKTTDAGQHFTFSTPGLNDLHAIYFTDHLNGYVVGNQTILQTTNGGSNWNSMTSPTANGLKDIHVSPDNRVMYAVGTNGAIIKNINTIGIEPMQEAIMNIYPNPSNGLFHFSLSGDYQIRVLDIRGALVKRNHFWNTAQGQLDLTDLSNGEYILQIIQQGKTSFGRIVVKH